jgi:hypothetical protein
VQDDAASRLRRTLSAAGLAAADLLALDGQQLQMLHEERFR